MDIQQVLTRVAQLQEFTPASPAAPPSSDQSGAASFEDQLNAASTALQPAAIETPGQSSAALTYALSQPAPAASPYVTALPLRGLNAPYMPASSTRSPGADVLTQAESQIGQAETTTNDGPAIAMYRSAVPGSQPGDAWCAEFVSWAAAQAGDPLGPSGQGFRSVSDLSSWAQQTGKLLPASAVPEPGDLILFGTEHVGIVSQVSADGSVDTVEGNYANKVSQVHRHPGEWTGFVRL